MGRLGTGFPLVARYTFRRHLLAGACEGVLFSQLIGLGGVVLVKGLGGSDAQVTLLAIVFPMALLLAPVWGGILVGRSKRPFFLGAGLLGRAPLVLMLWVSEPGPFVALLALAAASYSVVLPAQNTIFQANYPAAIRGRIFGIVAAVTTLAGMASAVLAGLWLEADEGAYRYCYPAAGLLGLMSCWLLARIKIRGARRRWGRRQPAPGLAAVLREVAAGLEESVRLLRGEHAFRQFELGFLLYGLGFMMLQPILPVFLVRGLGASYLEAALAKQGVFGLANMVCLPLWGRLVDRIGPIRMAARAFGLLALFPLALAGSWAMGPAYLAFAVMGAAMAGVNILWNLASIHFARERDAAPFQALHVALVGARGAVGPLLGYAVLALGAPRLGMLAAAALLAGAVAVMHRLAEAEQGRAAPPAACPPSRAPACAGAGRR
ncbi:MAG: hypothetical protein KatS3mg102_0066 [Planctomycetota bacterium]|nr:MAG: hypothetical protein KatS3mg102_0066 [Planctomycetota bacterium]